LQDENVGSSPTISQVLQDNKSPSNLKSIEQEQLATNLQSPREVQIFNDTSPPNSKAAQRTKLPNSSQILEKDPSSLDSQGCKSDNPLMVSNDPRNNGNTHVPKTTGETAVVFKTENDYIRLTQDLMDTAVIMPFQDNHRHEKRFSSCNPVPHPAGFYIRVHAPSIPDLHGTYVTSHVCLHGL
jgi:hypothetical protein